MRGLAVFPKGTRVRPSAEYAYGPYDTNPTREDDPVGTVIGDAGDGWVYVQWDGPWSVNCYRTSAHESGVSDLKQED